MDFINNIQDDTIIICENKYKEYLLKKFWETKIFLNVKIISKKEFFCEYLFDYNEKTISYLVNKYNYKVDIAKMYLENLYYIEDKKYKSKKLKFLVDLKNELIDKNLLIFNSNYKSFISKYKILVLGYPYLEKNELKIFEQLNATIVENFTKYDINKVYEFETQVKEINFVCKCICKLITNGMDINKIKLIGISEDYLNDLERIFGFYKIPIKINNGESLYGNEITQKFLSNFSSDLKKSIELIKDDNPEITKKIIDICNKYTFEKDFMMVKSLIINDLKNTKIDNFKLKNYVEIIDIFDPIDDEYVFFLNFNVGNVPKHFKDEDYITDDIKNEVDINLINEKNKVYKSSTIDRIKNIKNLVISYKLNNGKQECYPSSLIGDLNLEICKYDDFDLKSYSYLKDKIDYAKMCDDFNKYGTLSEKYYIYKNSLGDISYKSYNNKFGGINKDNLKEFLKGKLTLSYSSLNNFNKCAFRYYLTNILKLDKFKENFETFIGSLFHDVLEKCFINDLDVVEEVNNYISSSGRTLSVKEKFYVDKIIEDIKFTVQVLKKQKDDISLDKAMYEKNIVIDKSRNVLVEFIGFIDKILYKENNDNTLVSIIDYKTGFIDVDLKYLPYGLSLQLPIYLYLIKKSNLFVNPKFVGFYLQYILDKDIVRDIKKDYNLERENNLKLTGYSNSDIHSLVCFDKNFKNSNLIKGMKIKNDGNFSSYSKVLNDEEIEKIIDLTENNIDIAIDKILDGEFTINPKNIGYEKNIGCMYCNFRDICFKNDSDNVILKDIKNLDFLRGDENA